MEIATLFIAYAGYFAISVFLLVRKNVFQNDPKLFYFIYAFVAFFALWIIIFVLSQKRESGSRLHWLFDRLSNYFKKSGLLNLPGFRQLADHAEHFTMIKEQFKETLGLHKLKEHWVLFALACLWQGVLLFTHVVTLYAISVSLGHPISFTACFVAFTFSKFLSMISIVPGAQGVFEGAMTLILITFGVDKSVALAATLLTRAFTFWLPMPIGWILYARYMKKFEALAK